ncbi:aldose 1-epimerase [Kaistia algarum]|uniref:aldose 1-epimerase n=1 Tax=Kaistia algarum TaxID=2083279 RepID=UPI000CE8B085|nr:aldose 1-epimerase [Kaistia algarum]MCX5515779.1 aldose 1-epimerase [Kaistia algarum]PPE80846.1 aldose 1-epimerase [Kaistia algarum]
MAQGGPNHAPGDRGPGRAAPARGGVIAVSEIITLANDKAMVSISPERGAATTRFDYRTPDGYEPVLRSVDGVANLVMAPWQNRISCGGFSTAEGFVPIEANVFGERFPIHGNAWQLPWSIDRRSSEAVTLVLRSDGPGAYRYRAELVHRLWDDGSLTIDLVVINLGRELPFGLGLHPYFPRTPLTTIEARAASVTLQDEFFLPTKTIATRDRPGLDFTKARCLPPEPINNDFGGWDGLADIRWPEHGLGCRLAVPGINRYVVYSPGAAASFFCFEPATHAIDAFNRPSLADHGGLVMLASGAAVRMSCTFCPYSL